jgi:cytochrome c oxidase assembly protein subunit 15
VTALAAPELAGCPARPASAGLYRFAVLTCAWILLHIKGGAMVTSTGSGMAFTDWPLADGSLWPPGMDLAKLFEHLHRVSGAIAGLLCVGLLVWVWRNDRSTWLRLSTAALLVMVSLQGLLGGLGVLFGEPGGRTLAVAAIGHGILAQPTLCVAVIVAFALSPGFAERTTADAATIGRARGLATAALGLVFVQVAVGAVVRHTNQQGMLWLHVFLALVVALAILVAVAYCSGRFAERSRGFRVLGRWTLTLLLVQLTLGFVTLAVRRVKDPSNIEYIGRSIVVSGHVVVGAVLFLLATLLVARVWRNLVPGGGAR